VDSSVNLNSAHEISMPELHTSSRNMTFAVNENVSRNLEWMLREEEALGPTHTSALDTGVYHWKHDRLDSAEIIVQQGTGNAGRDINNSMSSLVSLLQIADLCSYHST
jgi:hypothetical protein